MFENCYSLELIKIPDSVKIIEKEAFRDSGLKGIVLP